jgi:hypothetical protein
LQTGGSALIFLIIALGATFFIIRHATVPLRDLMRLLKKVLALRQPLMI